MRGLALICISISIISLSIDVASALKCYTCESTVGAQDNCELGVEKVPLLDCQGQLDSCLTLTTKSTIKRGCALRDACNALDKSNIDNCSICDENVCNSGFVPGYSASLGISIVLFTFMKIFM